MGATMKTLAEKKMFASVMILGVVAGVTKKLLVLPNMDKKKTVEMLDKPIIKMSLVLLNAPKKSLELLDQDQPNIMYRSQDGATNMAEEVMKKTELLSTRQSGRPMWSRCSSLMESSWLE